MRRSHRVAGQCLAAALFGLSLGTAAQAEPVGLFQDHGDVGSPAKAGGAAYDAGGQSYALSAGGENMFAAHDEFQFVWRKLAGDFVIQAHVAFTGPGAEPHRKAGLIARSSLDADAAYVDAVVHGDGPKVLQVRRTKGAETEMQVTQADPLAEVAGPALAGADFVQLERKGNTLTVTIRTLGKPATRKEVSAIELGDEIYVGLFLCAHDPAAVEHASFRDVRLTQGGVAVRR